MSTLKTSFALLCLLLPACVAPSESETIEQDQNAVAAPKLTFAADFTQTASAQLVGGARVDVAYDAARLNTCRGNIGNGPGWSITAFYSVNGLELGNFPVAGQGLSNVPGTPGFTMPFAGDLAVWFQITNAWGCMAYDSSFGNNYHFNVAAPASAPGWVGNASVLIDRATCNNGGPCYDHAAPLTASINFDTWSRERAAIKQVFFDVWKQGVTDHQNPNLWRDLDVEVHTRSGSAPFAMSYVNFAQNQGNDARYAVALASLDLLPNPPGGAALSNASQCPKIPATVTPDGQYVQADLDLYFTANGVALQPTGGGAFRAHFSNYAGLYAVCNYPKQ